MPAATASGQAWWARAARWADLLLTPSATALRRWALAGVITSALIILTGAAVRLSQSGLGCPDWPAAPPTAWRQQGQPAIR